MTTSITPQQIQAFVTANIADPSAIAAAAQQYGVSSAQIAQAMGTDVATVDNYFSSSGITPPNTVTAPATTTVTPQGASGSVYQNIINAIQSGGATVSTQNVPVPNTGRTQTQTVLLDANGNVVPGSESASISQDNNGQITIQAGAGTTGAYNINTQVDASGKIAPVTDSSQVSYQAASNGGLLGQIGSSLSNINLSTIGEAALAYAIPVAGEYLAEALSTASMTIPSYVGTAMAATAAGVAQGQDVVTAAKNALPNLVAQGVMSQSTATNLLDNITNSPTTQQYITNAATSALKTVAAGGSGSDIENNILSSVAGTAAGQGLNSQTLGQTIGTTLASGSVSQGLIAGAGTAGSQEAATMAKLSTMQPVTDSNGNQLYFDLKTGKTYNPDGTLNSQSGVPGGAIGTQIASADGTFPVDVTKIDQVVNAENAARLGFDTSKIPVGYTLADQATADAYKTQFGLPLQNTVLPDGTYVAIVPTDFYESVNPGSTTTTDVTAAAPAISTGITQPSILSNASPTMAGVYGNLGNVSVTGTQPTNLANVTVTGTNPTNLGNVTITGQKLTDLGNVTVTGQKPSDLGNVTITGTQPADLGNVSVVGQKPSDLGNVTVTGSLPSSNVSVTTPETQTVPSVITDYVKPKVIPPTSPLITSQPTALTGVTQGLGGAAGGVNVESGKEQQPVWNISSLKLQPGEEETTDYSNLSSALGI